MEEQKSDSWHRKGKARRVRSPTEATGGQDCRDVFVCMYVCMYKVMVRRTK